jgi:hypothetical protein
VWASPTGHCLSWGTPFLSSSFEGGSEKKAQARSGLEKEGPENLATCAGLPPKLFGIDHGSAQESEVGIGSRPTSSRVVFVAWGKWNQLNGPDKTTGSPRKHNMGAQSRGDL